MTDAEFIRIYRFMKSRYGIDMERKKEIIQGRLENYIVTNGFGDFSQYMNAVEMDFTGNLERELVNILTTNHTFFMREFEHFDYLRQVVLPQLKKQEERKRDLCIWCGAASTGQEPYMLAMLMKDYFGLEHGLWDTKVLATDISTGVLKQAMEGVYTKEQIEHIINTTVNELAFAIFKTPGKLLNLTEKDFQNIINLADKLVHKLNCASYAATLAISTKINYKDLYNKIDFNLFFDAVEFLALEDFKNSGNKQSLTIFNITNRFKQHATQQNLIKETLMLNYLTTLWEAVHYDISRT